MLEFIELLTAAACRPDHHLVLAAGGNDGLNDIEQLIHSGAVDGVVPANVLSADERVAALARNEVPFACVGRTDPDMPRSWIATRQPRGSRHYRNVLIGHQRS
jgi:DNA-binding LacI/PurR family transcriptional regulator